MNKTYVHKSLRAFYYSFSLILLFISLYKIGTSNLTFYLEDYIFLIVLIVSFILLNKYSIVLKDTNLNFNDFILIVCYMKFDVYITILLISFCYLATFFIEYKHNKKLNLLTENLFIFNSSLVILSIFIAHLAISSLDNIYYIKSYETTSLVIFSIILLIINYILFCFELSVQRSELTLITLENGLYYILLNFVVCTIIASIAIYLYRLYGYMPIVAMTAFIIFISFSLNNLNRLKTSNKNLKAISECTTFVISKADFKVKLQNAVKTIESMLPFVYCGIYFSRDKYDSLYPISYKCRPLVNTEDLKFASTSDNKVYSELLSGSILYKDSSYFLSSLPLIKAHSKEIKYTAAVPIKNSDNASGFIILCFNRYMDISEELQLLSTLGNHIGMVNFHISTNIKNNTAGYKSYDGLVRYIDYNIKYKIFFTLAVIEIQNYKDILNSYNSDFYEAYKLEVGRLISNFLSPMDSIQCFEREDIYIIFNLQDSKNSTSKLNQIAEFLESFKFNDIVLNTKISYAVSEYPVEGINGDEILSNVYRKLQKEKSA
jgi:GGDEF domain-containing protein